MKEVIANCDECNEDIHEGDVVYTTHNRVYCSAHCAAAVYIKDIEQVEMNMSLMNTLNKED
ncbi:hypothetical protein [Breznakia pachnodae]|uniref:Uncharacterized protein n=1 Tax=Breznakia pachnodae TaxID=265178 RepID=A0ABU0E4L3_9FIRM|nr:hypothetical protein [Breznakia pachnodae]MDQ0361628.1 hypothetical protein [Breznakia pachnodae]